MTVLVTAILRDAQQAHKLLTEYVWPKVKGALLQGHRLELRISDETRTVEQNAAQWPILEAFSKQLQWPVNAQMVYMTREEWKDVLTAAFNNETVRLAMGLHGGVVMLGGRTSKFSKKRFSEWLDFLHATAAARGVVLDEAEEAA